MHPKGLFTQVNTTAKVISLVDGSCRFLWYHSHQGIANIKEKLHLKHSVAAVLVGILDSGSYWI